MKKISKSGIVAYFIYSKSEDKNVYFSEKRLTIDYFDKKSFEAFIDDLDTKDGILQKFEDPIGENNHMIRVSMQVLN